MPLERLYVICNYVILNISCVYTLVSVLFIMAIYSDLVCS